VKGLIALAMRRGEANEIATGRERLLNVEECPPMRDRIEIDRPTRNVERNGVDLIITPYLMRLPANSSKKTNGKGSRTSMVRYMRATGNAALREDHSGRLLAARAISRLRNSSSFISYLFIAPADKVSFRNLPSLQPVSPRFC